MGARVFPWRLISGEIFNNRLLFKKRGYCFPYCFLDIFMETKALMKEDTVVMGQDPPLRKTLGAVTMDTYSLIFFGF